LTYADGVADIELGAEFDFHREHGKIATMTVVRPVSPWGKARIDDDGRITGFTEKPRLESWINGGFMILEPQVFDYIEHDEPFEEGPLARLAAADELFAFRHDGFWDCMDTFKDALVLNDLCRDNQTPPWLTARTAAHEGSVR
ncbi:MAG TPA: sugar phosphate nucleotidyltransferase, partial [Solirubrobacterales bacterium]|nr:sugar phosphate nucleotidyltransferase [Solirubrobacterales bacterium]